MPGEPLAPQPVPDAILVAEPFPTSEPQGKPPDEQLTPTHTLGASRGSRSAQHPSGLRPSATATARQHDGEVRRPRRLAAAADKHHKALEHPELHVPAVDGVPAAPRDGRGEKRREALTKAAPETVHGLAEAGAPGPGVEKVDAAGRGTPRVAHRDVRLEGYRPQSRPVLADAVAWDSRGGYAWGEVTHRDGPAGRYVVLSDKRCRTLSSRHFQATDDDWVDRARAWWVQGLGGLGPSRVGC